MHSSSWPILLGLIALVAGAVWFDAAHTSPDVAAAATVVTTSGAQASK